VVRIECEHGALARQCERCLLADEITALRAECESAHQAQRDAENDLSKALARMAMAEGEAAALRAQVNAFYLGTPERRLLAMTRERDALRERLVALEDGQISYVDKLGDMVGQDDTEPLHVAIARVMAERDALLAELQNIANAQPATQGDDWRDQFQEWAQSRARHTLATINAARGSDAKA